MSFLKKVQAQYAVAAKQEKIELPADHAFKGFNRYDHLGSPNNPFPNSFYKELDRYRRHDHGGGDDGDDWLSDEDIDDDYQMGEKKFSPVLTRVNEALKTHGFEPNAYFELGEKGHFSINFDLKKA